MRRSTETIFLIPFHNSKYPHISRITQMNSNSNVEIAQSAGKVFHLFLSVSHLVAKIHFPNPSK